MLDFPVSSGSVAKDGRVQCEIGTFAAACYPPLAIQRMSAMSGGEPRVMQGQHDGQSAAQLGHLTEIEIRAVQVMAMKNLGSLWNEIQELAGAGKPKVLISSQVIQTPDWIANRSHTPSKHPRGTAFRFHVSQDL